MLFPFNTFTIHNLIGFMVTGSLAAMFYIVYVKAGRRRLDVLAANFIFFAGLASLTSFLTDNLVPAGMSAYGWPGGPSAEMLKSSTLKIHRLAWISGILGLPTQLHFILYYCQKRNFLRRHVGVLYALAFLLLPTMWSSIWISAPDQPLAETSSWRSTIPWLPSMGPAAYALMLCVLCVQTYGLLQLWKTKRLSVQEFEESLGGRRIVFMALMVQMLAALGDIGTSATKMPIPALAPMGAGLMGILLSIALIRSRVEADRARTRLQAENLSILQESNIKILAAREEECRRVAGDLHDSVAQGLTSLQMQFTSLVDRTRPDATERKQFEVAVRRCTELGKEVRQISHQLYPPALDLLGLGAALEEVFTPYRAAGVECTLESGAHFRATRLSQAAEVALYRIAQEAMSNATRHGKATRIDVRLEMTAEEVCLTVTDNGTGFEVGKKGPGLGMTSMGSRIAGVGGRLEAASEPGRTCIKARVPWASAKRQTPPPRR